MSIYDINGNEINFGSEGGLLCKDFGSQPAANGSVGSFMNTNANYNALITNVYEPLRAAHPEYISRHSLGKDASNTYDMWCYEFEPRYYKQHILLVSGIHANEPDSIACLARIMQMITNESDTFGELAYLRQNVKITVVPVVNVWGYSQSPKNRTNVNNASIQTFTAETPIAEVANMKALIDSIGDELSFVLDMHTTTNNTYKDFYGVINMHDKNVRTIFRVNSWLCQNYGITSTSVDDQYLGYLDMPGLFSNWVFSQGITSATLELSDYHWDSSLSTATVITMGVTMFLNYIFQQVLDEYKLMEDIPDGDYRHSRA